MVKPMAMGILSTSRHPIHATLSDRDIPRKRTRQWAGTAGLLAVLVTSVPGLSHAAQAENFSAQQRSEIIAIVREALRNDPSILEEAITSLRSRENVQQAEASTRAIRVNHQQLVADPADPVAGNPHGNLTIVEFLDPRCGYCRAMLPVMAELLQKDPQLRLVYKELPVLGPNSVLASRALMAANRQNGYLKLQDILMHGTAAKDEDDIRKAALKAGLDPVRLLADMNDPIIMQHLQANIRLARDLGVEGTPALVVGDSLVAGATELATLQQLVATARQQ